MPGQEKEEGRVSSCAEAMQDLAELEILGLNRKKEIADEIVSFYRENGVEAKLPDSIQLKIDVVDSLDNLTGLVSETSYELYTDESYSSFIRETLSALQDVNFGKDGVVTEHEIFEIGKGCGIPNKGAKNHTTLQGGAVDCVMKNASKLTGQMAAYQEKVKLNSGEYNL